MKKLLPALLLPVVCTILNSGFSFAQDTLFSENFDTVAVSFTLNTADVNSTAAGYNSWVVNNSYTGGNGSITCIGIPFTFSIPTTPAQPSGNNSMYLHTVSSAAISSGVTNCCFQSADGLCNNAENYFTSMSADVNTAAYDSVNFSFQWLCAGGNNSYGEVYYSTDAGLSWTILTPLKYNNQSSWTQQNLSTADFAHQNTLRFGFRFANKVALNASDPGFGVDDVMITASTVTGLENISESKSVLTAWPNPFNQMVHLKTNAANKNNTVLIYNAVGAEVHRAHFSSSDFQIPTALLIPGIYHICLQTDHSIVRQKLIKQ